MLKRRRASSRGRIGFWALALLLMLGVTGLVALAQSDEIQIIPAPGASGGAGPHVEEEEEDPPSPSATSTPDTPPAPLTRRSDDGVRQASGESSTEPVSEPTTTRAVARFEGTAAPGLRVWLSAEGSTGEDLRYRWVQTRGPAVDVAHPDAARVPVLVPGGAAELEFVLLVVGKGGNDSTKLRLSLELLPNQAPPPASVVADAGDDQTGVVGHMVTLNGIRSTPRERSSYRWIEVEGPRVRSRTEEGWICSFVPEEPGIYRFLLVTAADGAISQPDEVRVLIAASLPTELAAASARPSPIEGLARAGLRAVGGGAPMGAKLADAFEGVAGRMSLYDTYEDVYSEISRRLEGLMPAGADERAEWDERILEPLSDRIVDELRSEGLDLDRPKSELRPLAENQKSQLATLFRAVARGFHDTAGRATDTGGGPEVGATPRSSPR